MARNKIPFSQNKHKTDIVCYLTLIGWLIAYFAGDRKDSAFHLNQALSILLADFGLNVVFFLATMENAAGAGALLRGVSALLSFCVMIFWILGLVRACQGSEKPVPILGDVQLLNKK